MDKRQMISAVALSLAIFALWTMFEVWYQKKHPPAPVSIVPTATQPAPVSTEPVTLTTYPTTNPATAPTTLPTLTLSAGVHVVPAAQSAADGLAVIGSGARADATYAMRVALSPHGAGIEEVTLNAFPAPGTQNEKLPRDKKELYQFEAPFETHPATAALATRALIIDGKSVELWNAQWTRVSSDANSATYQIQLADADGPLADLTKTFRLDAKKEASEGYEVAVEQSVKSLRPGKTLSVHVVTNGPTPPPAEVEKGTDHNVVLGYSEPDKSLDVELHPFTEFRAEFSNKDLTHSSKGRPFSWAGQSSSYFTAIILLPRPEQATEYTAHADAWDPTDDNNHNVALTLETVDLQVSADKPVWLGMNVYFGPKWRDVLGADHYSAWPRMYDQMLTIRSGLCGFFQFSWLITTLVKILGFFHLIFRDWGLAIICLVLLVRTLLHPITKRSQVQMMKMGKLGPEVEKLKKKYADQPDVLNREMMQIYKQQGGAILGCLPMFLQTPIWIALWSALQSTFELRQAPFFYGLTWIKDLAKPDRLIDITALVGHPIPLIFGWHLSAINILPILMAVVTYVNQKYFMPVPIAATPEQEQQQKMQRGMSLLFPLMFYSFPSGLTIYYLTTTTLGIVESKIVRDHIKEREEAEKAGKVIIATKATRTARRRDDKTEEEPAKPTMMSRMMDAMAKAQARAEEIRKESQKRDSKDRRN